MERILSKTNKKIKAAFSLKNKPENEYLVEGFHLVNMAFEAKVLSTVFAIEDPHLDGVETYLVNEEIIDKLASTPSPQGIVGVVKRKDGAPLSSDRVLVLDRLQDPGNIGTLLRNAVAFGFHDVIFIDGTASPYKEKAIMATQGAGFYLNYRFLSPEKAVAELKEQGYAIIGSALRNSQPLEEANLPKGKVALIVGNEAHGMSDYLMEQTDINYRIAIETIESLNAGVAGGILMYLLSQASSK